MQDKLLKLIADIHDAALDPALWDAVMRDIAALVGGHAVSLQRLDIPMKALSVEAMQDIDPDIGRLYAEQYAARDPWLNIVAPLAEKGKAVIGAEIVPPAEMQQTDVFNEIYRRLDIDDFISIMIDKNEHHWRFLSINRSSSNGTFSAADKAVLSALFPHLRSALAVRDKLLAATADLRTREAALHGLAAPVLLLARNGRVLFANAAAEVLFLSASPFALLHGELLLADSNARRALASALEQPFKIQSFAAPRGAGLLPWIVHLTPVSSDSIRQHLPQSDDAVLLLTVSDPLQDSGSNVTRLRAVFGFTQAETDIACHIAAGKSVEEISSLTGRSPETVRSHIKSLFSKTGTHRQPELISLLLRTLSPFEQRRP